MSTTTNTVYSTTVLVTGGRDGHARSDDGLLEVELSMPKEMGGAGSGTNPEQLFAAGYAACFQSALRAVARQRKVLIDEASITATVGLRKDGEGGFSLDAQLRISLPGVPAGTARELATTVHESVCPYSKAIQGNVDVVIEIE